MFQTWMAPAPYTIHAYMYLLNASINSGVFLWNLTCHQQHQCMELVEQFARVLEVFDLKTAIPMVTILLDVVWRMRGCLQACNGVFEAVFRVLRHFLNEGITVQHKSHQQRRGLGLGLRLGLVRKPTPMLPIGRAETSAVVMLEGLQLFCCFGKTPPFTQCSVYGVERLHTILLG